MKRALAIALLMLALLLVIGTLAGRRFGLPVPQREGIRDLFAPRTGADPALAVDDAYANRPVGGAVKVEGVLRAEVEIAISAEVAGRIVLLGANVGDAVNAGDLLVRLSDELLMVQIEQAEAAIQAVKANLALAQAGVRQQELVATNATVDGANALVGAAEAGALAAAAGVDAAAASVRVAQAKYERLAAGATPTELELAEKNVELARIQLWAAQATRDAVRNGIGFPLTIPVVINGETLGTIAVPNPLGPAQADVEAAEARIVDAEGAIRVAELAVAKLRNGANREELAVAQTAVKQAEADFQLAGLAQEQGHQAIEIARAQLEQAEAQRSLSLAGSRPADIVIAQAKAAEAQAQRDILNVSAAKLSLTAPIAGIISQRFVHEGEVIVPGTPLFVVSALDPVVLMVYADESSLARINLGQIVDVSAEAYPGKVFEGQVIHVASEGEFTPRTVQAQDVSSSIVFAVRIRVPNNDQQLRPGMWATAYFR